MTGGDPGVQPEWTVRSVELWHEDSDSLRNWDGSLRYEKPLAVPMFLGRVIGEMPDGRRFFSLQWLTAKFVEGVGEEKAKTFLAEMACPPSDEGGEPFV